MEYLTVLDPQMKIIAVVSFLMICMNIDIQKMVYNLFFGIYMLLHYA